MRQSALAAGSREPTFEVGGTSEPVRDMRSVGAAARRTFSALQVRNFRLYFIGQFISISGTWMQSVAQAWLVLKLTNSGIDLGIVAALAFVPMLVAGSFGGLIVDRFPKRNILYVTQSAAGLLALALGLLTAFDHPTVWDIYVLAFLLGIVNLFDLPARQAFVQEMVGRDLMANAVSLNSVLVNAGRIAGPALGGILIATLGISACFFVNAGSFVAVLLALVLMRGADLHPIRRVGREKGQVRAGLRYAFAHKEIRNILIAVGVVGVFTFNFPLTLPLLVRQTFHAGAAEYGFFTAMMGVGAIFGGLFVAHRSRPSAVLLTAICFLFGVTVLLVALAPGQRLVALALIPTGAASIAFIATANAALQLLSAEEMRGRVMALYSICFLGSTPIGAPLMGVACAIWNPRIALAIGAAAAFVGALVLGRAARTKNIDEHELPVEN